MKYINLFYIYYLKYFYNKYCHISITLGTFLISFVKICFKNLYLNFFLIKCLIHTLLENYMFKYFLYILYIKIYNKFNINV